MADAPNPFIKPNYAFDAIAGGENPSPLFTDRAQTPRASTNPANKINIAGLNKDGISSKPGQTSEMKFPVDLGKYKFVIIEGEFLTGAPAQIDFERSYELPLPIGLKENYTTQYDTAFGYVSETAKLAGVGGITDSNLAASGFGVAVNQYKTVTLKNPDFNMHNFAWKLSPKNFDESNRIRQIIYGLKRGMQPRMVENTGDFLFGFPKVYLLMFVPNITYMYKLKPCVLRHITIDYQGGHPAPAFYAGPDGSPFSAGFSGSRTGSQSIGFTPASSPPESVVIQTQWLELEWWTQEDFERGDGMLDPSPLTVFNRYNNGGGS